MHARRAFTLIELLVVVAIIALLIAIVLPALGAAREQAKMVREYAAARTLYLGYSQYATDQRGNLLPAHIFDTPTLHDDRGTVLSPPEVVKRWPWRLVSSMGCGVEGSLLVNEQAESLADRDVALWSYAVSLTPSLGLNTAALGGFQAANNQMDSFNTLHGCVMRIDASFRPSWQVVFASARFPSGSSNTWGTHGYWSLNVPNKPSAYSTTGWTDEAYDESGEPAAWGYVHPRWGANRHGGGGRAAVMHLDGHAEGLGIDQLRDMTRWSDYAARRGDPAWDGVKP